MSPSQVRGLYNVPRRRLPANPHEWHGRYRVGSQPGHRAPGFRDFAVYETAHPATTTSPQACNGTAGAEAMDILQLSCPTVVMRVCLPDLGVDALAATRATEGENPSVNQASKPSILACRHCLFLPAIQRIGGPLLGPNKVTKSFSNSLWRPQVLSLDLPELQGLEAYRLYRQRGVISISVFDELQPPHAVSNTCQDAWRPGTQPAMLRRHPQVFLGAFDVQWRSLLPSAAESAAHLVGSAAAADALSRRHQQQHQQHHQQQLFERLFDVAEDGTCCLGFLNGCFRLRQPRALVTHARVTQGCNSAISNDFREQRMGAETGMESPLDMFVSLKLEIRGPALAICCGLPRPLLPEDLHRQQQHDQQQQDGDQQHHQQPRLQPGKGSSEEQALICHDLQWRQRARRCGVWTPPSSIGEQLPLGALVTLAAPVKLSARGWWLLLLRSSPVFLSGMDSFGSLRLLCRLLFPVLPPASVAVPFEPHCLERTAAFVSLLPSVEEHQLFKGKAFENTLQGMDQSLMVAAIPSPGRIAGSQSNYAKHRPPRMRLIAALRCSPCCCMACRGAASLDDSPTGARGWMLPTSGSRPVVVLLL